MEKESLQEVVSRTVRVLLADSGMSQADLARLLGRHPNQVTARFKGRAQWSLVDLEVLADHWGCHPWDLMQGPAVALSRLPDRLTRG